MKLALAELRNQRGMTQEELAKAMKMSLGGVQYLEYEAKTVKLDLLDRLCHVLKCEPGELFKRETDPDVDKEASKRREELKRQKSERMKQYWAEKRKKKSKTVA